MKIVTVVGARPQFIKAATVSRAFKTLAIDERIIHTGQHFDQNMSDIFFEEMEIPRPHHHLAIHSLNHGAMTGRMLEKIEDILLKEKPDGVLVYGDTNSTLAGALAAAKLHIPVAHVEAGLRSFDLKMPEEINRILTDRVSKILFCPTKTAIANLEKEGYRNFDCKIEQSGDVMLDAVLYYEKKAAQRATILKDQNLAGNSFALATLHRAENTNDGGRLKSICSALNKIHETITVVLPLHPRTKTYIDSQRIPLSVKVVDPVGYFDMLSLLQHCSLVLTDSGGLQKEAYFFGKYCITLRDQTEWVELVEAGANTIVGASFERIVSAFTKGINKTIDVQDLYGTGDAAMKIARTIAQSST